MTPGTSKFLIIIIFLEIIEAKFNSGEKVVKIVSIKACDTPGVWPINATAYKYNRTTQLFDISTMLLKDIGDDDAMEFELQLWSDGGWKRNYIYFEREKACSTILFVLKDVFREILLKSGRPAGCPCRKGLLNATGVVLNAAKAPVAVVIGRVKTVVKFKDKARKVYLCFEAVSEIAEKM